MRPGVSPGDGFLEAFDIIGEGELQIIAEYGFSFRQRLYNQGYGDVRSVVVKRDHCFDQLRNVLFAGELFFSSCEKPQWLRRHNLQAQFLRIAAFDVRVE